MSDATDRLRSLVADETGECCDGDLQERVSALEAADASLGPEAFADDLALLSALAGETRYRIVRLAVAADEPLCVCEFDAVLEVTESAVSHALADLVEAGLLDREKRGRWRFYAPTDRARRVLAALDDAREAGR